MRRLVTSLSAVLVATGTALAAGVVTAAPASAAVSCSGTVTYSKTYGVGELTIFYNSSDGGTNSACFYHRGAAYGVAAPTLVQLYRCVETSGEGQPCRADVVGQADYRTDYAYYAGPSGVSRTDARCVSAYGYIDWRGTRYPIDSGRQGCPR